MYGFVLFIQIWILFQYVFAELLSSRSKVGFLDIRIILYQIEHRLLFSNLHIIALECFNCTRNISILYQIYLSSRSCINHVPILFIISHYVSAVFHQPLNPHTTPPPIAPGSILASVQRPYLKMEPASLSTNPPGPLHLTAANINSWPSRHKMLDTHVPTVTRTSSPSSVICTDSILGDNLLNTNCSVITNGSQQMICSADSPHSGTNSYVSFK